jgi:hypothetical protein
VQVRVEVPASFEHVDDADEVPRHPACVARLLVPLLVRDDAIDELVDLPRVLGPDLAGLPEVPVLPGDGRGQVDRQYPTWMWFV